MHYALTPMTALTADDASKSAVRTGSERQPKDERQSGDKRKPKDERKPGGGQEADTKEIIN